MDVCSGRQKHSEQEGTCHSVDHWSANPALNCADQISDFTGARASLGNLSEARWLLADQGYDTYWFR